MRSTTGSGWRLLSWAVLLAGMWALVWGVDLVGGARESKAAQELPADLAAISPAVEGFACLHVAELWDSKPLAAVREKLAGRINKDLRFQKEMGVPVEQIERVSFVTPTFRDLDAPVVLVRTRRPYDRERVLAPVGDKPKKETVGDRTIYMGSGRDAWCLLDERTFAFGSPRALRQCLQTPTENKDGPISDALKLAGDKHLLVQAANWVPMTTLLRNQSAPEVEPYKALLNARTSLLVVDLDEKVKANLQVSFGKEDEAKEALETIRGLHQEANKQLARVLPQLRRQESLARFIPQIEAFQTGLQKVSSEQQGKVLHIQGRVEVDPKFGPVVLDLTGRMREAAKRAQSQNNVKQIAIAMHNHNDAYGQLPTQAIYGKDGKPLLSWRVAILPFMEKDGVYKEFHLNEPWDSEHNKKLLARMPPVYASPADPEGAARHQTHYLSFVGPGAFFEGKKGLRIPASFPDGTSNTILVVEASQSVPWTKPEDIPFDPEKKLPKIGGLEPDGFLAGMCDGSVRKVSKKISKETLGNAINRMDGKALGPDW